MGVAHFAWRGRALIDIQRQVFPWEFLRHLRHHLAHQSRDFIGCDAGEKDDAEVILVVQHGAIDRRVERVGLANPVKVGPLLLHFVRRLRVALGSDLFFGRCGTLSGGFRLMACRERYQAGNQQRCGIRDRRATQNIRILHFHTFKVMKFFLFREHDHAYIV